MFNLKSLMSRKLKVLICSIHSKLKQKKHKKLHCNTKDSPQPVRCGQGHFSSDKLYLDIDAECLKKPECQTDGTNCMKYYGM